MDMHKYIVLYCIVFCVRFATLPYITLHYINSSAIQLLYLIRFAMIYTRRRNENRR